MRYNDQWVFRNIHGYSILINILDNRILSISAALSEIFEFIESDDDLNNIITTWVNKNKIDNKEKVDAVVEYFVKMGVFINE